VESGKPTWFQVEGRNSTWIHEHGGPTWIHVTFHLDVTWIHNGNCRYIRGMLEVSRSVAFINIASYFIKPRTIVHFEIIIRKCIPTSHLRLLVRAPADRRETSRLTIIFEIKVEFSCSAYYPQILNVMTYRPASSQPARFRLNRNAFLSKKFIFSFAVCTFLMFVIFTS